jgi:hypothetical protein
MSLRGGNPTRYDGAYARRAWQSHNYNSHNVILRFIRIASGLLRRKYKIRSSQ